MMNPNHSDGGDGAALRRAALGGLCGACAAARLVRSSRGSLFLLCAQPELPKYPGQPVLRCAYFAPREARAGGGTRRNNAAPDDGLP